MTPNTDTAAKLDFVLRRLETRWKWIDDHPGHPLFTEREDSLLVDLKEYERIEDERWANQRTS